MFHSIWPSSCVKIVSALHHNICFDRYSHHHALKYIHIKLHYTFRPIWPSTCVKIIVWWNCSSSHFVRSPTHAMGYLFLFCYYDCLLSWFFPYLSICGWRSAMFRTVFLFKNATFIYVSLKNFHDIAKYCKNIAAGNECSYIFSIHPNVQSINSCMQLYWNAK
jgi:hypothetical protein